MTNSMFDEPRRRMDALRREFRSAVDAIRKAGYSDEGRKAQLAATLLEYRQRAQELRSNYDFSTGDTREKLIGLLFGVPTGTDGSAALSYRDATDRVVKLKSASDAMDTLESALLNRDFTLARAVAGRAYQYRWLKVVDHYAAKTGQEKSWDDLRALASGGLVHTGLAALFSVSPPDELKGLPDPVLLNLTKRLQQA